MNDAHFKRNSTHDILANLIESNQDIRAMTISGLFSTAHAVPKAHSCVSQFQRSNPFPVHWRIREQKSDRDIKRCLTNTSWRAERRLGKHQNAKLSFWKRKHFDAPKELRQTSSHYVRSVSCWWRTARRIDIRSARSWASAAEWPQPIGISCHIIILLCACVSCEPGGERGMSRARCWKDINLLECISLSRPIHVHIRRSKWTQ